MVEPKSLNKKKDVPDCVFISHFTDAQMQIFKNIPEKGYNNNNNKLVFLRQDLFCKF